MVSLRLLDYFFTDLNQHLTLNTLFDILKLCYSVIDDFSLNKDKLHDYGGKMDTLAFYIYPIPKGTSVHRKELSCREHVLKLFDACQIIEAFTLNKVGFLN